MKSRGGVSQKYLHIPRWEALGYNEGGDLQITTQHQNSQMKQRKM
ncbi:protein of unknown function [Shewanella benthica]|uniref:Uncharacterized protein n=1 Tax=Shewanella benthica TaxID=43661 RepID=A0A330M0P2_9GAMM|nr:hypothetical protein [Shewanella benthica]SQH75655.1 protein of unknown function [Shewanella benthica]